MVSGKKTPYNWLGRKARYRAARPVWKKLQCTWQHESTGTDGSERTADIRPSWSDRRWRDTEGQSSCSGHRGGCLPAGYLHVTCFPESRFSAPIAWSIIIVPNKVRLRFRDDDCLLIEHGSLVLFPSQYTHTSQSGASLCTRFRGERTTCTVASVHLKDKQGADIALF